MCVFTFVAESSIVLSRVASLDKDLKVVQPNFISEVIFVVKMSFAKKRILFDS